MAARTLFRVADRLYATTTEGFLLVECANCRLLRLFPRPRPEDLSRYYPSGYWFAPEDSVGQLAELYRRFVLLDHVAFVRQALSRTATAGPVLDVGPSGGLLGRLLRDRGVRVFGLDNSFDAARIAWKVNGLPSLCADLAQAPLRDGAFALVTLFHVLEHVPDPERFLRDARRLLAPEGRLIVQVPNAASWQFVLLGDRWNGLDAPRHLWNFRTPDLERLLDRCGFDVVRRKHFSLRDNPAGFATSLAPGLDPMARRVRGTRETPAVALAKNLAYLLLTMACAPVALLEAACRAGSTIMIEAKPRP